MNILVNGIGNIGRTLLGILTKNKELLGITKVYALKNTQITAWNKVELDQLEKEGVTIVTRKHDQYEDLDTIKNEIHYIFDATSNGFGQQNKDWYEDLPNLIGASAQGSEKNFGLSFMAGIDSRLLIDKKYVHIVSCNTHAIASLLNVVSAGELSEVLNGDFVVVRRSEDLGNHQRLVSANVVSRHMDPNIGTHHAIDVVDLYKPLGINLPVQSSDITTPSQLMHTVRFNICLGKSIDNTFLKETIDASPFVSQTNRYDSNIIFEQGRRYSEQGRIYSHAIINSNNLLIDQQSNSIKGWAFIPQEGNTILSTILAFIAQVFPNKYEVISKQLQKKYIQKTW